MLSPPRVDSQMTTAELHAIGREASEQQRHPSGGVSMLLVFNPANEGAGPDCEFAVALR